LMSKEDSVNFYYTNVRDILSFIKNKCTSLDLFYLIKQFKESFDIRELVMED
jgi:hypothetical protein